MTPAFGFGVGDFVAVATLVWQISQALSDASEDSKLYRELRLELAAFQAVFVHFQQAVVHDTALPPDQVNQTREVLAQIERLTNDFNNHMEKFKVLSNPAKDKIKRSITLKRRISWTLYGKKPIQQFREAMRGYSAVLTLIMHTINSSILTSVLLCHILIFIPNGSQAMQSLHQEMQNGTKQLKLHVDNTFQEPWDQKPIRFQDAIGRRYPVPLEICGTFEVAFESFLYSSELSTYFSHGFLDFLKHAFKDDPVSKAVGEQSIWLFSPVVGETKAWVLITTDDWTSSLYPGMHLSMSVFNGSRTGKGLISDTLLDTLGETEVRLQTPLPLWASATFPENAVFKLRYDKTQNSSLSYPCPNDIGCGKRFESQEEFLEHLKPEIFDLESFESFRGPSSQFDLHMTYCLFCDISILRSSQMAFERGIALQQTLTSSSRGLTPCVAEMMHREDLGDEPSCHGCYKYFKVGDYKSGSVLSPDGYYMQQQPMV
ncbi:hypothetical protein N7466_003787 [Penicillium verhagenii]|uniref:uncharacterized protein n=1 Tax=Penicillium verhagenii TaxID=1562060 RepID=UPI0025455E83|nr:uncharacterized protein N7466_003787 [Penicillium verhagenii]KAJ5934240.1 hypothetical protein N7466_003787 [Penicillium verhagenii]